MASNEPVGDNARKGAVRKRSQLKGKVRGKTAWTKRDKTDGKFMAVKKGEKNLRGCGERRRKPLSSPLKNCSPWREFADSVFYHESAEAAHAWRIF